MNRGRSAQGMTLLELLVAVGIFTVVASTVYLVYAQAVRVDREVNRRGTALREAWWTLAEIREDVERAVFYRYTEAGGGAARLAWDGQADRLSLVVAGDAGLQWVTYQTRSPDKGGVHSVEIGGHYERNVDQTLAVETFVAERQVLVRMTADFSGRPSEMKPPILPAASYGVSRTGFIPLGLHVASRGVLDPKRITAAAEEDVLTALVLPDGLRFQYSGGASSAGNASVVWQDTWTSTDPPAAVRVTLRLASEEDASPWQISDDIWLAGGGPDGGQL